MSRPHKLKPGSILQRNTDDGTPGEFLLVTHTTTDAIYVIDEYGLLSVADATLSIPDTLDALNAHRSSPFDLFLAAYGIDEEDLEYRSEEEHG